jgi:pterin-4a-carbinolamine dehydratase
MNKPFLTNDPSRATQIKAALGAVQAIGDAIRELGSVPSGVLYHRLSEHIQFVDYVATIDFLKKLDLVEEHNNCLFWKVPMTHVVFWTTKDDFGSYQTYRDFRSFDEARKFAESQPGSTVAAIADCPWHHSQAKGGSRG